MFDVDRGGRPVRGASLAMLLARAGHRVALVDRASFPSDTMSTHFVWQRGAARLRRLGTARSAARPRGCAPIRADHLRCRPGAAVGIGPAVGQRGHTYCPRRTVLDALLVDAAVEAGAELIDRFVVDDVFVVRRPGRGRDRATVAGSAASSLQAARRRGCGRLAFDDRQTSRCPRLPGASAAHRRLLLLLERARGPRRCVPRPPRAADPGLAHQRRPDLHLRRLAARQEFHSGAPGCRSRLPRRPRPRSGAARGRRVRETGATLRRHRRPTQPLPDLRRAGLGAGRRRRSPQRPVAPAWACPTPSSLPTCWPTPSTKASTITARWTTPRRLPTATRRLHHQRLRTHLEHRQARAALAQPRSVLPDRRRPTRGRPPSSACSAAPSP